MTIDRLIENNRRHLERARALEPAPRSRVAIVTCMDCRIDIPTALGVEVGDAHVLRNAGGLATDDVIRSLAISQRRLGTREVMIIGHTDCGMQALDEREFASELSAQGGAPDFAIGAFADLEQAISESVRRVRTSPFLPHTDAVRGFIYDVATHELTEV